MGWFRTGRGILLGTGIFCFLVGLALATGTQSAVASLASIFFLTAGAITTTWGLILALRRLEAPRKGPPGP